jgi:hypothetical protein
VPPIDENSTELRLEPIVAEAGETIPVAQPAMVQFGPPKPRRRKKRKPAKLYWVYRLLLAIMVIGLLAIFTAAAWIRPYDEDGTPRTMATHTQLGLDACNMVVMTGKPCPACGMTTSFSLLVHGDVLASMNANWVGTILALSWMALMAWGLISVIRARIIWPKYGEIGVTVGMFAILVMLVVRWLVIFFT